jgi:hypothetical protein
LLEKEQQVGLAGWWGGNAPLLAVAGPHTGVCLRRRPTRHMPSCVCRALTCCRTPSAPAQCSCCWGEQRLKN